MSSVQYNSSDHCYMTLSPTKRFKLNNCEAIRMWSENDIYIVGAKRTPCGSLLGSLSSMPAPQLGAVAHRCVLEQAHISPNDVDEVISGCVLQAGIGQGPARQAAVCAGLPYTVATTTVNKMCGSGMVSVMMGCNLIRTGNAHIVLTGGMESMSQAPFLLSKARYYTLNLMQLQ